MTHEDGHFALVLQPLRWPVWSLLDQPSSCHPIRWTLAPHTCRNRLNSSFSERERHTQEAYLSARNALGALME